MKRAVAGALLILSLAAAGRADPAFAGFEDVQLRAKQLAEKPYVPPAETVPASLRQLTYDEYRDIRFIPARTWWAGERLPFQLQFFHPGFMYDQSVKIREVADGRARLIRFDPDFFDYGQVRLAGRLSAGLGFAGFRVLCPLNRPDKLDELVAFLGASYFRALGRHMRYGLSARGLAINTGDPAGEEFPRFEEFWVEKPHPSDRAITLYALLNGPSETGAYRFTITPGDETVMDVRVALYLRRPVAVLGLAPLTSMFWHGELTPRPADDFRPEVHDSDGLLIARGDGEWLWRPLVNPAAEVVASFADENPRGFGLLQRDRNFDHYQDLEACYQLRPSAWVEPVGAWGAGAVRLVELPTPDETRDNIVACWVPAHAPPPGQALDYEYRLHWFMAADGRPPAGYVVATRLTTVYGHPGECRFLVDFDGPYLHDQPADPGIEPVITVGAGAKLAGETIQKNPFNGTWRVTFALQPDGSGRPVELRCFLQKPPHILTETWSYRWNP